MQSTDQSIAKQVQLKPVHQILEKKFGLTDDQYTTFGKYKAKVSPTAVRPDNQSKPGKLVLVTGVSPTAAGEGKTTTSIGLTDALNQMGINAAACLREPSLGPCFGMKGGAHGGGWSQVAPAQEINLHFNGDLHAITTANNLLSSMLENHIYWGNQLEIDTNCLMFARAIDMNDRGLRSFKVSSRKGTQLDAGFNITAASEVMAVFSLAQDLADLQRRLGNIVVAKSKLGDYITAKELEVDGAMTALLKDALVPNFVQTLEHSPAFVHGGPFANIAHGCNTVVATRTALGLADVVVTEAGFGADLGAEKFINIKCRQANLKPDAVVIVSTIRSIKMHAHVSVDDLGKPNLDALNQGIVNLERHVNNLVSMGAVPIVALNQFESDTNEEVEFVKRYMSMNGIDCRLCTHWFDGGKGAIDLAGAVMSSMVREDCSKIAPLYENHISLEDKIKTVATKIYHASKVVYSDDALATREELEEAGFGEFPVCLAKTQYSFSADPTMLGAPTDHELFVREIRLSAGAEFVVVICGAIMTMPGLPRVPAAHHVKVDKDNNIEGI